MHLRNLSSSLVATLTLVLIVGCLSVPEERTFREMEQTVASRLDTADILPHPSPDQTGIEKDIRDRLADGVTVEDAVRITLANNRRVLGLYEQLNAAAAARLQSRLLKNPEAEGSVKVSEEDSDKEVIELVAEINLLHILLLPKKSRMGEAEYDAARLDISRAILETAFETRTAFYTYLAVEEQVAMRKTVLNAAEASYNMAARLREAGNIKKLDLMNRRALYEQAKLDLSAAEFSRSEAREQLNVLMGLWGGATGWKTVGSLRDLPSEDLNIQHIERDSITNSLVLQAMERQITATARQLGITRVKSVVPQLHVGVEAEREPEKVWLVGPMIGIEIPLFDFGQAQRPKQVAMLKALQHRYVATAVEIRSAARVAAQRAELARQRVAYYDKIILPLRRNITYQTQLQYNAMQLGVFQLLQAKQMEIAAEGAYIDELRNYWVARTELDQIRRGLTVDPSATTIESGSVMGGSGGGEGGH
jgi:cobalt-zinc-cadmium efflux system outer membrane protein